MKMNGARRVEDMTVGELSHQVAEANRQVIDRDEIQRQRLIKQTTARIMGIIGLKEQPKPHGFIPYRHGHEECARCLYPRLHPLHT